jgi:hypothetical protein
MQKLARYILGMTVCLLSLLIFSCEDEKDPVGPNLIMNVSSEDITPGSTVTFDWYSYSGDASLATLTIKVNNEFAMDDNGLTWNGINSDVTKGAISNMDNNIYIDTASFTINDLGLYHFVFILTDYNGLIKTDTIAVDVGDGIGEILEYTGVILGAQDNTFLGSTVDLNLGFVYKIPGDEAKSHASAIDVCYYFDTSNKSTFAAPDDEMVNGSGTGSFNWTSGWLIQNSTRFSESSLSSSQFDSMTDDEYFNTMPDINASRISFLDVNDVIEFITANNKKGAFKVTGSTLGAAGSITITVKIQD